MDTWRFLGRIAFTGSKQIDLPYTFTKQSIILDLDSPQKKETWQKAGNVIQIRQVTGIARPVEISNTYSFLGFEPTLITLSAIALNPKLRFKPVPWLTQYTIAVYESDIMAASDTFILGI